MGANYYFFISTLPYLRLGAVPPLSSAEFIDLCSYNLSRKQLQELSQIGLIPRENSCCVVERSFNAFETALRNSLSRTRAKRMKVESQRYMRAESEAHDYLDSQVQEILGKDPLQVEQQLDGLRWRFLEDLSLGHPFDFSTLLIYRIKLLLLEKRARANAEEGRLQLDSSLGEKLKSNKLPEFIHAE